MPSCAPPREIARQLARVAWIGPEPGLVDTVTLGEERQVRDRATALDRPRELADLGDIAPAYASAPGVVDQPDVEAGSVLLDQRVLEHERLGRRWQTSL